MCLICGVLCQYFFGGVYCIWSKNVSFSLAFGLLLHHDYSIYIVGNFVVIVDYRHQLYIGIDYAIIGTIFYAFPMRPIDTSTIVAGDYGWKAISSEDPETRKRSLDRRRLMEWAGKTNGVCFHGKKWKISQRGSNYLLASLFRFHFEVVVLFYHMLFDVICI